MKIEHIAIWVKDIERVKAFYETYFQARANQKYHNPKKGFQSYFLSFDTGARLEIMQMDCIPKCAHNPVEQRTGLIHFAVSVGCEVEVDRLTNQLCSAGYAVLDGPRTTGDGYYESIVLDPEGNRIELTV